MNARGQNNTWYECHDPHWNILIINFPHVSFDAFPHGITSLYIKSHNWLWQPSSRPRAAASQRETSLPPCEFGNEKVIGWFLNNIDLPNLIITKRLAASEQRNSSISRERRAEHNFRARRSVPCTQLRKRHLKMARKVAEAESRAGIQCRINWHFESLIHRFLVIRGMTK